MAFWLAESWRCVKGVWDPREPAVVVQATMESELYHRGYAKVLICDSEVRDLLCDRDEMANAACESV